jgi:TatD DNase family protein
VPAPYIDIHTHHNRPSNPGVISVRNILMREARDYQPADGYFSIGLHPWESDVESLDKQVFEDLLTRPEIIAVGECGLDRLRGADMRRQTGIFIQQALLAEKHRMPVYIHCVRAWDEITGLKKELSPTVPWMVHGYRGKARVADQLIDNGFYLSFGENILSMNRVLSDIVRNTPIGRMLLETDEGTTPIEEIYAVAAKIKNLSLDELQACLLQNFELLTGIHGTSRMASTH